MGGAAAGAWWRSRPRSTIPGRLPARSADAAVLLGSMAGFDPKDSTSADRPVPDFAAACARGVKGLRIGVPREYRQDGMAPEIGALWDQGLAWLREAGAETVDVCLPHTKFGLAAYYIIAPAEASSNLARYDGVRFGHRVEGADLADLYERTRADGFGEEVRRRILIGTYVLSAGYYDAYYTRAQKVRALILRDFTEAFREVDALLTPTTPNAAFALGAKVDDPVTMYLNDVFTVPGRPGRRSRPVRARRAGRGRAAAWVAGDGTSLSTRRRCSRWAPPLEHAAGFTARPRLRAGESTHGG